MGKLNAEKSFYQQAKLPAISITKWGNVGFEVPCVEKDEPEEVLWLLDSARTCRLEPSSKVKWRELGRIVIPFLRRDVINWRREACYVMRLKWGKCWSAVPSTIGWQLSLKSYHPIVTSVPRLPLLGGLPSQLTLVHHQASLHGLLRRRR